MKKPVQRRSTFSSASPRRSEVSFSSFRSSPDKRKEEKNSFGKRPKPSAVQQRKGPSRKEHRSLERGPQPTPPSRKQPLTSPSPKKEALPARIRLIRYLALAGVASRRNAAKLIQNGQVEVNGQTVREPWMWIDREKDTVTYRGRVIYPEKPIYILLNKPKNTVCTVSDEKGRKTVLDLLEGVPPARLYPIGRLDRNTTGILLLTNDGDLAQKLLHPRSKVPRTYRVTTVKPMNADIVERLLRGLPLTDGVAQADEAHLEDPYTLILTLHIGRKHIVRRMMEHMGYRVKSLDRIAFGPITRKGVPRGKWRLLTPQEVGWLKMLPTVSSIPSHADTHR
ncbi:MAG: pseudouridine synthase [Bacteroidia bacterium]|nr:pseudouridine synthase [Bacteroidia bacterium]